MTTPAANLSSECFQTIGACATRVARLKANGAFAPSPHNVYVSDALIDVSPKRNTTKGDNFVAKDGCGNVRATFQGCDSLDSIDVTVQFLEFEPSMWEMMTGGTVYMSGGKVVGWQDVQAGVACPNGVSLEVWSRAWNVNQQVVDSSTGALVYMRVGYPKIVFTLGDYVLGNDITKFPLTGHAVANAQFALGPYADWPGAINGITAHFADTGFPAASCGYLSRTES